MNSRRKSACYRKRTIYASLSYNKQTNNPETLTELQRSLIYIYMYLFLAIFINLSLFESILLYQYSSIVEADYLHHTI